MAKEIGDSLVINSKNNHEHCMVVYEEEDKVIISIDDTQIRSFSYIDLTRLEATMLLLKLQKMGL